MTYATNRERFSMIQNSTFDNPCPFVVRFEKEGRESELIADDIDHALDIQRFWIDRGANYVEIFLLTAEPESPIFLVIEQGDRK